MWQSKGEIEDVNTFIAGVSNSIYDVTRIRNWLLFAIFLTHLEHLICTVSGVWGK